MGGDCRPNLENKQYIFLKQNVQLMALVKAENINNSEFLGVYDVSNCL